MKINLQYKAHRQTILLSVMIMFILFLVPFSSAFSFTSIEEFTKDGTTSIYGKYQIYEKDLFLFKGDLSKEYELKTNTEVCGGNSGLCESYFTSTLLKEGTLVDKWNIYNKETMKPDTMRWLRLEYYGDIIDYTSECSQTKLTEEEILNETKPYETCIDVQSGSHKDWIAFQEGEMFQAGTYEWRGIGDKAPWKNIEWTFETSDIETTNWATWGNISTGSQAEVRLNAPEDESIQYSNPVTLNASANVTGGAYLVNATLYDNSTGTWGARNSTTNLGGVLGNIAQDLTDVSICPNNTIKKTIILNKYVDHADNEIGSEFGVLIYSTYSFTYSNGTNFNVTNDYAHTSEPLTYNAEVYTNPYPNENVTKIEIWTSTPNDCPGVQAFSRIRNDIITGYNYTSNTTKTFYNTYPTGTYNWNMLYCDSDGVCGFATSNRTFSMDTNPPTISISSGNGTQTYGNINTNHTLNYTITDTNLDDCWLSYNSTNRTIPCTSGAINTTNFTLQYNLWNATLWANDTLGNTASQFVNWSYKVFETNRTFSNETLSGSIEDFSINVTLYNETEIVSATFVYNGTNTSSVITSVGDFRLIIIDDFEIPVYSSAQNISFYWEIILSDGTNFTTYASTHLVNILNLDNCSVYTFQLANISLFDEETLELIRGDIEVYYSILNKPNYNSLKNLSGIFENVSNTLICSDINLSNQNLAYSSEIRYSSDKGVFDDVGYSKEFYHIQKADIGESIAISLYDLHLNETTEFEIEYQNENLVRVANAVIQLQRKYISEDIYRVVEAPITSNEGTAVLHLDLNTNKYKITVSKDGVVLDTFDNIVFICENELSGTCKQKLYGSIDPTNDIPLETILDFTYTLSEVNNTITIDFSIPTGVPSNINFLMYQSDQFGTTTLCNRTIISSAGSTSCTYNNTITDSYLDLILTRDGNVIFSRTYIVPEADGIDFLDNNFFIVFIFLISIVGMAFTSPEWIIMNSVIVFVISGALWLLNGMNFVMGLGGLAWLILGAGILIFKLTKQEDR